MIAISDPDDSFGVGVLGACHSHRHNPVFYLSAAITAHNFISNTPHLSYNMRMGRDLGAKLIVACSFTDVELMPGRGRLVKAFRTWGFRQSESCFSITLSSLF